MTRPAIRRGRVDQVETVVAFGQMTAFADEGLFYLDTVLEPGLALLAKDNGGVALLPPAAFAVVAAVKAGAQRHREGTSPVTAVVAATERNSEAQLPQPSGGWGHAPVEMSVADAAAWWRITPAYVRKLALAGHLPARRGPRGAWVLDGAFVTVHRTVADAIATYVTDHTEKAAA